MPVSLKKKLAGKEAEVVNMIKESGSIEGTMLLYGVRSRQTFDKWLRENTEQEWKPNPLSCLKGGEKHKFLWENRDTILGCLELFGRPWVEVNFRFTHSTLDRFIHSNGEPFTGKLTRLERVELDNRDLKARVNRLEKRVEKYDIQFARIDETYRQVRATQIQVSQFEVAVGDRIGGVFTQAFRQSLGKFIAPAKEMLPQPPDLSIGSLVEQRRKVHREAEEVKKARKVQAVAKKEATLVAQRQTYDIVVKEVQGHSPEENPLVETISRLKEG